MNQTRKDIIVNILKACAGLFFCAFGTFMTLRANIGVAPYDVLHVGLSRVFGMSYGNASILVSLTVLIIDILLKEKIGIGMVLDAFLVGKYIDFFYHVDLIPVQEGKPVLSVVMILVGLFLQGSGQTVYMRSALGCGPRDTMFVGLSRRLNRIPIGAVNSGILVTVTVVGYFLGGPLGIGTILCAVCSGPLVQFAYHVFRFDPKVIRHQDILTSMKVLIRGSL